MSRMDSLLPIVHQGLHRREEHRVKVDAVDLVDHRKNLRRKHRILVRSDELREIHSYLDAGRRPGIVQGRYKMTPVISGQCDHTPVPSKNHNNATFSGTPSYEDFFIKAIGTSRDTGRQPRVVSHPSFRGGERSEEFSQNGILSLPW